ncbi:hypothetical protein Tco_0829145 [Tanacetum coccineum]
MGDENPIRTLGDYSKHSHEATRTPLSYPKGTTWYLSNPTPSGRTAKLRNDILMFQQHQREYISEAWTHFKDLLQKVPHHGIDLWLQVQIFYYHVNLVTRRTIDQSTGERRLSSHRAQLGRQQDDVINKVNSLWKVFSKRLNDTSTRDTARNSMAHMNVEDEVREEENVKPNATKYNNHKMTAKAEEKVEEESEDEFKEEIKEEEEEEGDVEYFNTFPTLEEL